MGERKNKKSKKKLKDENERGGSNERMKEG